eukprot:s76_g16.t1
MVCATAETNIRTVLASALLLDSPRDCPAGLARGVYIGLLLEIKRNSSFDEETLGGRGEQHVFQCCCREFGSGEDEFVELVEDRRSFRGPVVNADVFQATTPIHIFTASGRSLQMPRRRVDLGTALNEIPHSVPQRLFRGPHFLVTGPGRVKIRFCFSSLKSW